MWRFLLGYIIGLYSDPNKVYGAIIQTFFEIRNFVNRVNDYSKKDSNNDNNTNNTNNTNNANNDSNKKN